MLHFYSNKCSTLTLFLKLVDLSVVGGGRGNIILGVEPLELLGRGLGLLAVEELHVPGVEGTRGAEVVDDAGDVVAGLAAGPHGRHGVKLVLKVEVG